MSNPKSPTFSREQILFMLKGMNVDLPLTTKLAINKLEHRLQKALDAAQRFTSVFSKKEHDIKPTEYPYWNRDKLLGPAFRRNTWGELVNAREFNPMTEMPLPTDAFARVSAHINALSSDWDTQNRHFSTFLRDPISKRALIIRVCPPFT